MAERSEAVIAIFQEYLDTELNNGYNNVIFLPKYGYIILSDYIPEEHSFHDTYVCETEKEFFDKMIHEYKLDYLFHKSHVLGLEELKEEDLSDEDKKELMEQLASFHKKYNKLRL